MCLVIFVEELTLLLESTSPLLSSAYRDDVATSARSCVRDMTAIWLADGVDSGACMYPLRPHPPDVMMRGASMEGTSPAPDRLVLYVFVTTDRYYLFRAAHAMIYRGSSMVPCAAAPRARLS
eukprot:692909-Prorocentrum_minimum.AAC.5